VIAYNVKQSENLYLMKKEKLGCALDIKIFSRVSPETVFVLCSWQEADIWDIGTYKRQTPSLIQTRES